MPDGTRMRALEMLDGFPPPQRRIGFICPLPVNDVVPYMFYGAFRERVMMVAQTLSLRGYDAVSARAAFDDLDAALDGVLARGAETIVVGGSVLSFAFPRPVLLARLAAASARLGVPVTTDLEAAMTSMSHAGVVTVAVAHRLAGLDAPALGDYLAHAGFTLVGIAGPDAPAGADARDETAIHTAIGLEAHRLHPQADAILYLGGSTVNYPYLAAIQRATGKPVFNNAMGVIDHTEAWLNRNS